MKFVLIAHKYNDAFYSILSAEYNLADKKILIIIEAGFINENDFPFKIYFDEVFVIPKYHKSAIYKYLLQMFKIKQSLGTKSNVIAFSNPILVINQLFVRYLKVESIILLEDGVMNYRNYTPSKSLLKLIWQKLNGISNKTTFGKITKSYLTKPEDSKFSFGDKKKIIFNNNISNIGFGEMPCLNGKKLFIGGDYYNHGFLSKEEYLRLVNLIINEFNIDYYIPHAFSNSDELVQCKVLNLNKYSVTLEMLAFDNLFSLYTFGNSAAFTCKHINSSIHVTLLKSKTLLLKGTFDFLSKFSDRKFCIGNNSKIEEIL